MLMIETSSEAFEQTGFSAHFNSPLSSLNSITMTDWLRKWQSDPNAEERYRALQQLTAANPTAHTVTEITRGLHDPDSAIRAGTVRWLAGLISRASRPGTAENWQAIQSAWGRLLGDPDPDVRFESARGLIYFSVDVAAAAAVLMTLLAEADTQPVMRAEILRTLLKVPQAAVVASPDWPALFQHAQSEVREQAAALAGVWEPGNAERAAQLLPLVDDEDSFVREEAVRALGRIGVTSPELRAVLDGAIQDEDDVVARAAITARQLLGAVPS